jgi:hypothetical protein
MNFYSHYYLEYNFKMVIQVTSRLIYKELLNLVETSRCLVKSSKKTCQLYETRIKRDFNFNVIHQLRMILIQLKTALNLRTRIDIQPLKPKDIGQSSFKCTAHKTLDLFICY